MPNIPFYTLEIDESVEGMDFMGLVDLPAHMKSYQAFSSGKQKPVVIKDHFNEEKRMVTGVAIAVDLPIYRNDNEIGEHYVVFKKDDTEKVWIKMMENNYLHNVNNMHNSEEKVEGISLAFCYQVDKEGGVYPEMFKDQNLKDGSIVVSYKAHTDEAWDYIKKNNGFSIEGWFAKKPLKVKGQFSKKQAFVTISEVNIWDIEVLEESIDFGTTLHHKWIGENGEEMDGGRLRAGEYKDPDGRTLQVDARGVVVMINGKTADQAEEEMKKKRKKSRKMKKRKILFESIFGKKNKFATVTTVDGIEISWDGELAEGVEITIEDENGDQVLAPEGDHTFENEDGTMTVITVDGNGMVTGIEVVDAEEDMDEDVEAVLKKIVKDTDERFEKMAADHKKEIDDLKESHKKDIEEIKETHSKEIESQKEGISQLCSEVEKLMTPDQRKKFNRSAGNGGNEKGKQLWRGKS